MWVSAHLKTLVVFHILKHFPHFESVIPNTSPCISSTRPNRATQEMERAHESCLQTGKKESTRNYKYKTLANP